MKAHLFVPILTAGLLLAPAAFGVTTPNFRISDSKACMDYTRKWNQQYSKEEAAGQYVKAERLNRNLILACQQGSPRNGATKDFHNQGG